MILLVLWSVCLGIGLAQAAAGQTPAVRPTPAINVAEAGVNVVESGAIDPVPARYQLGQQLYLQACASCHIGIPPQVLPIQTWQQLLQDSQHYGITIKPLVSPELQATWGYIQTYSRPTQADEPVPYRVYQSRYFKAIHPRVELPNRLKLTSCATCHPGAGKYDFRTLSSEWQNAP